MQLPVAPSIDMSTLNSHEGIKRKRSLSGKDFTNVEYFGSPNSGIFHRFGAQVMNKPNGMQVWNSNLQSSASFVSNSNLGRKSWQFSISSCPAQYLFPAAESPNDAWFDMDTAAEDANFTPSGYSRSYSIGDEGMGDTDSTSMKHHNLSSIVRLSANGMIPLIFCQDWENKSKLQHEGQTYDHNQYGMLHPSLFHIVRFKDYPTFDRVTNGFWDTSFSLEESW